MGASDGGRGALSAQRMRREPGHRAAALTHCVALIGGRCPHEIRGERAEVRALAETTDVTNPLGRRSPWGRIPSSHITRPSHPTKEIVMKPARGIPRPTLVCLAAVLAITLVQTGCGGGASPESQGSGPASASTSPSSATSPQSMEGIDGALQAGFWKVPLYARAYQSLPWAVVEVPDGYGSPGGWTVDRGADGDPEHHGSVGFWSVGTVMDDPCHASTGTDPGPTVRNLAEAIHRQIGHRATAPVPVTLDGHTGLYLEVIGPDRKQLSTCVDHGFTLWRGDDNVPCTTDVPGTVFQIWVLDVNGDRIVVNEATSPNETRAEKAEVRAIAESTHFTTP